MHLLFQEFKNYLPPYHNMVLLLFVLFSLLRIVPFNKVLDSLKGSGPGKFGG